MKLILASASPRRREILENAGYLFSVRPVQLEERLDPALPPGRAVAELAAQKAACAAQHAAEDELILAQIRLWYGMAPFSESRRMKRMHSLCFALLPGMNTPYILAYASRYRVKTAKKKPSPALLPCAFTLYRMMKFAAISPQGSQWIRLAPMGFKVTAAFWWKASRAIILM